MTKKPGLATSASPPATRVGTPVGVPCTVCGGTPCLTLVRADMPPVGLIDLIDRALVRLTSGHWTARQSVHLGAIIAMVALAAFVLIGDLSPMISHTAHLPWGWVYLTGSGLLAGGGYAVRRIRRRQRG